MKKSNFVAMLLGTVSGMLFALGMCMVLISEWNSFKVVGSYTKIEDAFVERYLTKEGESVEEAKARLKQKKAN